MATAINEVKLQALDQLYSLFLQKKMNESTFETELGKALSALPLDSGQKTFTVSIVNKNHSEPFFGFRIFPAFDQVNDLLNIAVNQKIGYRDLVKKWKSFTDWYIEVDANALDRVTLNFNPKECTALTLHEIGHTVYSDRVLERFYRAYQENYARLKMTDRASLKVLYSLYAIPLVTCCKLNDFFSRGGTIKEEYFADKVLIQNGYKEALVDAMNKIIHAYGNSIDAGSERAKDSQISASINWANLNIADLTKRRDKLKDDLYAQSLLSDSKYLKALSFKLLNRLGVKMREKYTGAVVESWMDISCIGNPSEFLAAYEFYYDIIEYGKVSAALESARLHAEHEVAMEGLFGSKTPKLPSQYDIDVIGIEIDRIENNADRIYVLDLIYNIMTQIDRFEDSIRQNNSDMRRYEATMKSMRDQLNMFRKTVIEKKISKKDYKLFVQYPAGYEG